MSSNTFQTTELLAMAWHKPEYSRTAVDRAGKDLLRLDAPEWERAITILSNWRSAHAFPLNTITMDLRKKVAKIRPDALVVQRLKRTRSVISKLTREGSMKLSRMQDIGGCRAVLNSTQEVEALRGLYRKSRALHQKVAEYDYIRSPKPSGYRGVHLVYRFGSRKKTEYNRLLIELQLRTELQHAWATAVETVGAVLGQALKASEGELSWLEFFQLASAAFAKIEASPPVPDAPGSPQEVARRLRRCYHDLKVREKLEAYRLALAYTEQPSAKKAAYFLLILRPKRPTLEIVEFSSRSLESAHREYLRYERELPLFPPAGQLSLFPELIDYSEAQAVLVGAESLRSLRASYPNYFLDTGLFLSKIELFIGAPS